LLSVDENFGVSTRSCKSKFEPGPVRSRTPIFAARRFGQTGSRQGQFWPLRNDL